LTSWRLRTREIDLARPIGAGIVNVTADSMVPESRSVTPERAIEAGVALVEQGFELLDVGAVAARSGPPVTPADEIAKLAPTVAGLTERLEVPVCADTFSPEVARAAVEAGAEVINDIGGGEPEMLAEAAALGCGYVLMHIEGPPRVDRDPPAYGDVVARLLEWFGARLEAAAAAGIDPERIVLDPGPDFDLTVADDVEILRRLPELAALGRPLYISISRKDFVGALLAGGWEERLPATERESGTAAATALATAAGGSIFRLHDASALDAMRVAAAITTPTLSFQQHA
jgi:dihydropteroate synthase